MHFWDLVTLIFANLSRRKGRVALTAVGVIIGTASVVVLVSLGIGLQQSANANLFDISELTQIQVSPNYGQMGGGSGMVVQATDNSQVTLITDQSLADMAALDGVISVVPRDYSYANIIMKFGRLEGYSNIIGIGTDDLSNLGYTAQQGTTELLKGTVIIGSSVAANFYDPKARPSTEIPPPPDLFGQTLKLTLIKYDQDGNEIRKAAQMYVAGVLNETRGEADWSIYVTIEEVTRWNEWVQGKRINRNKDGYQMAVVKVGDLSQTLDVTEQITNMGYQAYTYQQFVQGTNTFYQILQIMFGGVGSIALLVAAIGIANTMTMAILERTREIGLMKAIGATNRDVLSIFLGEAAGIGFIGGLGGIVLGWGLGQAVNVFGQIYLASQVSQSQYGSSPSISASTPSWLLGFTLLFATLMGLLSGLYPALRAATLVPVNALKYE
jgi:putative ABC transport system permease protein